MIMAIIDRIRQTIATVAADKVFVITDSNVAVVESRLIEALDAAYVAVVEAYILRGQSVKRKRCHIQPAFLTGTNIRHGG